jgi:hypothetical protein
MHIGDAKAGDEVAPNTFFLGWDAKVPLDHEAGAKCPRCGGYAEPVDATPEEIASDLNCGRLSECCCAAFVCGLCGTRIVGNREAPEMD